MNVPSNPQVLVPVLTLRRRAERLFSDDNLDFLVYVLDDWFRIPGTRARTGLDGLLGIIPGIGDLLTGILSCILIVGAWIRGVPYVALTRMVVNLGIGVVIGAIPFAGDLFDIAWKANQRNYAIMVRHLREPRRHTWKDYVYLSLLALTILVILATPVVVLILIILWLVHRS
ncbi:MAG TPA: DUF4112 domain-containing protein [Acidobacteriaceae bacterium]|nr:DUF4112 domain-containing protein [Acidobacteriaceae bacterium]